MNINSRIDWKAGMAISAQTFLELDENLRHRQQAATRAVNGNEFGLIPFTEFDRQGGFVRNKLEIDHLACMALLPSGKILHIDEKVVVTVPLVYGNEYYLACGFGEKEVEFDVKEVPFVRPEYTYGIYSLSELEGTDLFPVMKFKVSDGIFSIDESYIPPCLYLSSNNRFQPYLEQLTKQVSLLAEHPNLESGEGKRAFQRYAYLLKSYDTQGRTCPFIQLTYEIAQAIDYYIVTPNTETPVTIPAYSGYDIANWLDWLDSYLHNAAGTLDKVVLEDHTIDFDELKAQIKAELYEQLRPELYEQLYTELKAKLYAEISEDLTVRLTDYINQQLKTELHDLLSGELSEELYESLYKNLYESLYNALYVPVEKEEDEFTPLI
ncbi:hypothetical protein [Caecibacteroides pullorum]|uniref:Uncharacterized protein n=1 Tax=Caecibacteroides pullorum TaxID=2725562 RepID=A0AA40ZTM1_9BACT|nr:hypothetical protein [Caecibacteroides pullorum]MBM6857801.1 hypothetical protein [Caecibacteroides pullorum]MBV8058357.1 hypothetical protein [Caecibacteroides pullorum]